MSKAKQEDLMMCYPLPSGDRREGGQEGPDWKKRCQSIMHGVSGEISYQYMPPVYYDSIPSHLRQETKINLATAVCLL